jgi:uncharacterized protein YodC (DUF2158 family)
MNKELAIGDAVRLNSGGPVMTVTSIYPPTETVHGTTSNPTATCAWMLENGFVQRDSFPVPCLTREFFKETKLKGR